MTAACAGKPGWTEALMWDVRISMDFEINGLFLSSIWFCFPYSKWIITLAEGEKLSDCARCAQLGKEWGREGNLEGRDSLSGEAIVLMGKDKMKMMQEVMSSTGGWRESAQQLGWKTVNLDEKGPSPQHYSLAYLGWRQTPSVVSVLQAKHVLKNELVWGPGEMV